jgi:hypothetical protein
MKTSQTSEEEKLTKVKNPGKAEEKAVGDKGKKDKAKKEAKKAKKDTQKGDKKEKPSNK